MTSSASGNAPADGLSPREHLRGHFLFLQIDLSQWDAGRREEFWTELAAWLLERGLYLGGTSSSAAIYAPLLPARPPMRIWQTVRRKLDAALGRRCQIDVRILAPEQRRGYDWAALEAVRSAQSTLAEAAGLCGEDLDRLLADLRPRDDSATRSSP